MNRNMVRFVLLAVLSIVGIAQAAFAAGTGPERIVIQVSDGDPKTWNQALNVVRNLQQVYGPGSQIEVVAFGNGIGLVKMDSEVGHRVGETLKSGARVYACQNTMRARKLTKDDMLAGIGYVPAGVVEIIDKQRQGWAVLRP